MKYLVTLLLFVSCTKEFVIRESSSIDNFTCPSVENCLSSQEKESSSNYIMPFKMIGTSPIENMDIIEKVIRKINGYEIERESNYIKASNDNVHLELIANAEKGLIEVRSQIKKHSFFSYDQGRKQVESIRFNFYQGNY